MRWRRWWREGGWPRRTRPAKRAPDTVPGRVRLVRWIVCARLRVRIRRHGSQRCCTMSVSTVFGQHSGRFTRGCAGGGRVDVGGLWAGSGGKPSRSACSSPQRRIPGETISACVYPEGGRTVCGRSALRRWRTRSSSGLSWRYSTRSMRWISWAFLMGFGRDVARMMRWMRWRSGSNRRE